MLKGDVEPMEDLNVSINSDSNGETCVVLGKGERGITEKRGKTRIE